MNDSFKKLLYYHKTVTEYITKALVLGKKTRIKNRYILKFDLL